MYMFSGKKYIKRGTLQCVFAKQFIFQKKMQFSFLLPPSIIEFDNPLGETSQVQCHTPQVQKSLIPC